MSAYLFTMFSFVRINVLRVVTLLRCFPHDLVLPLQVHLGFVSFGCLVWRFTLLGYSHLIDVWVCL